MSEEKKTVAGAQGCLKAGFDLEWRKELRKADPGQGADEDPAAADARARRRGAQPRFRRGQPAASRPRPPWPRPAAAWTAPIPAASPAARSAIDIPSFVKLIEKGEFLEAAWKIKETNSPAGHLRPRLPPGNPVRGASAT